MNAKNDGGPAFPCLVEEEIGIHIFHIVVHVPTEEESEAVQLHAFSIGLRWCTIGDKVQFRDSKYLFFDETNGITHSDHPGIADKNDLQMSVKEFLSLDRDSVSKIFKESYHQWVMSKNGMSLRDYFAAKAMQAFFSNSDLKEGVTINGTKYGVSEAAYMVADDMLEARTK